MEEDARHSEGSLGVPGHRRGSRFGWGLNMSVGISWGCHKQVGEFQVEGGCRAPPGSICEPGSIRELNSRTALQPPSPALRSPWSCLSPPGRGGSAASGAHTKAGHQGKPMISLGKPGSTAPTNSCRGLSLNRAPLETFRAAGGLHSNLCSASCCRCCSDQFQHLWALPSVY